jgi:hypothetical protein
VAFVAVKAGAAHPNNLLFVIFPAILYPAAPPIKFINAALFCINERVCPTANPVLPKTAAKLEKLTFPSRTAYPKLVILFAAIANEFII